MTQNESSCLIDSYSDNFLNVVGEPLYGTSSFGPTC